MSIKTISHFLGALFKTASREGELSHEARVYMLSHDYLNGTGSTYQREGIWGSTFEGAEVDKYLTNNFLDVWNELEKTFEIYGNINAQNKNMLSKALARHVTNITQNSKDPEEIVLLIGDFLEESENRHNINVKDVMEHASEMREVQHNALDKLACNVISTYGYKSYNRDQILKEMKGVRNFNYKSRDDRFSMEEILDHAVNHTHLLTKLDYFSGVPDEVKTTMVGRMESLAHPEHQKETLDAIHS